MIAALRYEYARLTTLRSTWWITGIAILIGLAFSTLLAWAISLEEEDSLAGPAGEGLLGALMTQMAVGGAPYIVAYTLAIIGVLAWGHEYRHGQIRATLTAVRGRTHVWVAKYAVVGLWVAATVLLTGLLVVPVAAVFLGGDGLDLDPAEILSTSGRSMLYAVLLCWIAMAFTGLVRNQAFSLSLMFVWPLVLENVVTAIVFFALPDHIEATYYLPYAAGQRILTTLLLGVEGGSPEGGLGLLAGVAVFGGFAAALMVASLVLFERRDA